MRILSLCIFIGTAVTLQAETPKPNIVMLFIDDMGQHDLSCFGGTAVRTPNIDQLAKEGIRFENFYVNSPICSPSRVALSTGQYPWRWNITSYLDSRQNNKRRGIVNWLNPEAPMLARILKEHGYATGHFGKWHMGGQRNVAEAPLIPQYGFDESLTNFEGLGPRLLPLCDNYDGKPLHKHDLGSANLGHGPIVWMNRETITRGFVGAAVGFIKQAEEKGEPFYVNVWPDDVHSPFFPPRDERGDDSKKARYHGVLKTMDEQFKPLFDTIRNSKKLRDNTIILLCSDNGPEPGAGSAGPLRGVKGMLYEGGIRSPLIVWAPGLMNKEKLGTVNAVSLFAAIDIAPSLMSLANIEPPKDLDGEDVSKTLLGHSTASREKPILFRRPPDRDSFNGVENLPDRAVRYGNWKLLHEADGGNVELYNLEVDPSETKNVAAEHPDVVKRFAPTR